MTTTISFSQLNRVGRSVGLSVGLPLVGFVAGPYAYAGLAGFVLAFALKGGVGYSLGSACLGLSFMLFILGALRFLAIGNSVILSFLSTTFNTYMPLMIGAYSIGVGFVTTQSGLVLKMTRANS